MKNEFSDQLNTSEKLHTKLAEIKPSTLKEMAKLYEVDARTLKKWLLPFQKFVGRMNGRYYTVVQVERILLRIGLPKRFKP